MESTYVLSHISSSVLRLVDPSLAIFPTCVRNKHYISTLECVVHMRPYETTSVVTTLVPSLSLRLYLAIQYCYVFVIIGQTADNVPN